MGMGLGYLALMFLFFLIGIWILRWALRINKIVMELELIRKALVVAHDLEEVKLIPNGDVHPSSRSAFKEAKKAVDKDNRR
jgi:hypothetical protein